MTATMAVRIIITSVRRLGSHGPHPSELERTEVIASPLLGLGTGEQSTVIIEVLDTPFAGAVAVLVNGNLLMKWAAYQNISEGLAGLHPCPIGGFLSGYHFLERSGLVRHCGALSPGRSDDTVPGYRAIAAKPPIGVLFPSPGGAPVMIPARSLHLPRPPLSHRYRRLDVGPGDNEVVLDAAQGEGGHRWPLCCLALMS